MKFPKSYHIFNELLYFYKATTSSTVSYILYLQWNTSQWAILSPVSHNIFNHKRLCLQWAIPHCKWVIISSMSHNIFNNSFYLKWAITFSMSHHISNEPSHLHWPFFSKEPSQLLWTIVCSTKKNLFNTNYYNSHKASSNLVPMPMWYSTHPTLIQETEIHLGQKLSAISQNETL